MPFTSQKKQQATRKRESPPPPRCPRACAPIRLLFIVNVPFVNPATALSLALLAGRRLRVWPQPAGGGAVAVGRRLLRCAVAGEPGAWVVGRVATVRWPSTGGVDRSCKIRLSSLPHIRIVHNNNCCAPAHTRVFALLVLLVRTACYLSTKFGSSLYWLEGARLRR